MNDPALQLPESVNRFIKQRQMRGDISAVLLYGSYARGTQHANSDVDIMFIVDQGFKRECVVQDGLLFEIIEETSSDVYSYWQKNLDEDRHWNLWKDVKVLYDRDGEGKEIINRAHSLLTERQPWPRDELQMRTLIMQFKIKSIRHVSQSDPCTAALLLLESVRALMEDWFRMRGRFVPSSKEIFAIFADEDPILSGLITEFYVDQIDLDTRLSLVERIFESVFFEVKPV